MISQELLLVTLVKLVDRLPVPPSLAKRGRGRPQVYTDRLFLKAWIMMIVRHLHTVHALLTVLAQPTPEMQLRCTLLTEQGQFPTRRTWERRLQALPATLPAQIGCRGRHLVALIQPWAKCGRAVAVDSTMVRAKGGVWHTHDREQGIVPHSSIDPEAHWTKSGWHGWVDGWKVHLVTTVADVWIPLAANLTPANEADNALAPALLAELPLDVRFVFGDRHDNAPKVQHVCACTDRSLVTSQHGPYPHLDPTVGVRRVVHTLRSLAIENFNEHFNGSFAGHGQVPTKGLANTRRFALGAIFVYQLTLWYRFEHGLDLRVGLQPFLKAA